MDSRTKYEKILLKEIKNLPDKDLLKVVKTVLFLKEEILKKEEKENISDVLRFAGIWKNLGEDKLGIFSEILKEREKFSKGRISIG